MSWLPLHLHSQYSLLDASCSLDQIITRADDFQLQALALTDHANLFGAIDFSKACQQKEIKPIIGCEFYLALGSLYEKRRQRGELLDFGLVLLAKNKKGYENLCFLSSLSYAEGFYYYPRIDYTVLKDHAEGLICLSGSSNGELPHRAVQAAAKGSFEDFEQSLDKIQGIFGEDLYLELQRHEMSEQAITEDLQAEPWLMQKYESYIKDQNTANNILIEYAQKRGLGLIATNDTHYLNAKDWRAHEVLINIQSGEPCEIWEEDSMGVRKRRIPNPKRHSYPSHELYFKSPEEMQKLFADQSEALSNSLLIADACNFTIDFSQKHYPLYQIPEDSPLSVDETLHKICEENIPKRYPPEALALLEEQFPDEKALTLIDKRLKYEMEILSLKGLCDYILIVYDFIDWAKKQEIPVGPGRGSGAGSLVCYLSGITDIDPLRFGLFFERFINPERSSYPDIDVDICMERRPEVIQYTEKKYGKDKVAQIITFGSMKAKMALRDVGRAINIPLSKINTLTKLIPDELNITLEKALATEAELRQLIEADPQLQSLIDLSLQLENCLRNTGVHAAGVVVSASPLVQHIPTCRSKDASMAVTQYSMKALESVGMLKIDFLGLKTLTCIHKAVKAIKQRYQISIDWTALDLQDRKTFSLFNQGRTSGVFQIESTGMQELAQKLHLDKFEEIIAVISLYRPGPMDNIPSFIERKHGREKIEYDHPWLEEILQETYGIMVYQEQVMLIASKLAGFSLAEGDILRRAMGKKDMRAMQEMREKFTEGCISNKIDSRLATLIFDKMEKFAAYGFNKSHAAAYAYISYVTAYLKAHYPGEWASALMSTDRQDTSKVARHIREARSQKLSVLPPDVNTTGLDFVATDQGIRFAMSAIKGIGMGLAEDISRERLEKGVFDSLYDFIRRMIRHKIGKKAIEVLAQCGALDFSGYSQAAILASIDPLYAQAQKEQKEEAAGVVSLFSILEDTAPSFSPPSVSEIPLPMRLAKEKELLGFFLTQHPLDAFYKKHPHVSYTPLSQVPQMPEGALFRSLFLIEAVRTRFSARTQRKFAILQISEQSQQYELPIWADLYGKQANLIEENAILYAILQKKGDKIQCHWLANAYSLTALDLKACDDAFDRTRLFAERKRSFAKKKADISAKIPEETNKMLKLSVDLSLLGMQGILSLKELFREKAGSSPLSLDLFFKKKKIALLDIDIAWGVTISPALLETLKKNPAILSIQTH